MYTPLSFFCRHSYGEQFSKSKWMKEMVGQRELLSAFAGIPLEDIRGMRAPFLAVRAPFKGRSRYIVSMVLSNSFSVRIEVWICVWVITFLTHALAKIGARNNRARTYSFSWNPYSSFFTIDLHSLFYSPLFAIVLEFCLHHL